MSVTWSWTGKRFFHAQSAVMLALDVTIDDANLPGAFRRLGLGVYWEPEKLEISPQSNRNIRLTNTMQNTSDWVDSDAIATNKRRVLR